MTEQKQITESLQKYLILSTVVILSKRNGKIEKL